MAFELSSEPPSGGALSAACRTCETSEWAEQTNDCNQDFVGYLCATEDPSNPVCTDNQPFQNLLACACGHCADQCMTECTP